MDRRESARRMRADGAKISFIAASFGVSTSTAHRWVADIRPPLTWRRASGLGYRMGDSRDLADGSLDVVAEKIIGDETIIACLSRLAVAMCAREASQNERN